MQDLKVIKEKIDLLKKDGKKIVFTNGCFDILHRGHITYLNEAKGLGDFLIIGLNSDSSVRGLKGPTRPINNEQDRKYLLENLKSVDLAVIFDSETPLALIKKIAPDVLVKGGDWSEDQIVGSGFVKKNGGVVRSLPFVAGHSTTEIIKKIQKN